MAFNTRLLVFLALFSLLQVSARSLPPPSSTGGGKADGKQTKALPSSADPPNKETPKEKPVPIQIRQGLSKQVQASLEKYGESITIMVVGETGVGKTTLLSNLLHTPVEWLGKRTGNIHQKTIGLNLQGESGSEAGVPFEATLVDSPGWGDTLSLRKSFRVVTRHLDRTYAKALGEEQRIKRTVRRRHEQQRVGVDVVLYIFSPHRCKGVDLAFLNRLRARVAIVPVLAKADTMTTDELARFRKEVSDALEEAGVHFAHPPLAVVCSDYSRGAPPAGRAYPWGTALSESETKHSELPTLRRFLLTDGLLALKQTSQNNYEAFRRKALRRQKLRASLGVAILTMTSACAAAGAEARRQAVRWLQAHCRLPFAVYVPSIAIKWARYGPLPNAQPPVNVDDANSPLRVARRLPALPSEKPLEMPWARKRKARAEK